MIYCVDVRNRISCLETCAVGRRVRRRVAGVSVAACRYRVIDVRVGIIARICICIGVRIVRRTGVDVVYQPRIVRCVYVGVRVGRVRRRVDG